MFPLRFLPDDLVHRVGTWAELKRWERKEIGQQLRLMGLSYREIAAVIPVHKSTLSNWCAELELTDAQLTRLKEKRPRLADQQRLGMARRMAWKRKRATMRSEGAREASALMDDPCWRAGVVAYWAEGAKNQELHFANSDPDLIRLFIRWAIDYLDVSPRDLSIKLHLHSGQDEVERIRFWSIESGIPLDRFRKTYVKPEGTGHRKNDLYAGTASIRIARSGALLQRVLGWIDALRSPDEYLGYTSAGR